MSAVSTRGALEPFRRLFAGGTLAGLTDARLLDRFLDDRDESAFAALVERHGPMVRGTCLAVLRDPDDAEDAFQAAFLTLVRRAPTIRDRDSIGGWLHRVARRVALRANARASRRRAQEGRAVLRIAGRADGEAPDRARDELAAAVHAELDRLPERHRLPVVLCLLEGRPQAVVACELRWSERTLRRRLAEARDRLRDGLSRRGLGMPAVGLSALLGRSSAGGLPAAWVARCARIAPVVASGSVVAPAGVADLMDAAAGLGGALGGLGGLVAVAVAVVAVGWAAGSPGASGLGEAAMSVPTMAPSALPPAGAGEGPPSVRGPAAAPARPAAPPQRDDGPPSSFAGVVLGPDGLPYEGARLSLLSYGLKRPEEPPVRAVSDADGRFRFEVPAADFDGESGAEHGGELLAVADGLAPGFDYAKPGEQVTLRLTRDDAPIEGRVVDLEGRGVPGATIRVRSVRMAGQGDPIAWMDDVAASASVDAMFGPSTLYRSDLPGIAALPVATADGDGRFRLEGIGTGWLVEATVEGPTIASEGILIRTRPGPTLRLPHFRGSGESVAVHGAEFTHVAAPSRPVEGVVRDADTGAPLAGITIRGDRSLVHGTYEYASAVTDAEGRYRLSGLPVGDDVPVVAVSPAELPAFGRRKAMLGLPPDEALPYLRFAATVPEAPPGGPARLDFAMKRGVWVSGRVMDKESGEPVAAANVEYFVYQDNPHLEAYPGYRWSGPFAAFTRRDGTFALIAFPGPGVLAARAPDDRYAFAVGVESLRQQDDRDFIRTQPYYLTPSNYHTVLDIDPAEGAEAATAELRVDPGRTLDGTVLDPDGAPLAGAMVAGQKDMGYWEGPLEGPEFRVVGLLPGKGRPLTFRHDGQGLVGMLTLTGDEPGPLAVRLGPWGSASGRLVDAQGEPIGGVELHGLPVPSGRVEVDREGRFRVDGLIPGETYRPYVIRDQAYQIGQFEEGFSVGAGEAMQLGDVVIDDPGA